jgi:zinc resistance-associated protein
MHSFKFRTLTLSLTLTALLGLAALAAAAGPYGAGLAQLSPEKQEVVKKLHEDFRTATKATRQELISKKHELDAQLYSANPDEKKVQALAKEISELRAKLYSARVSLKGRLIQEGVALGHGKGHGKRHGMGCGEPPCGGMHGDW